MLELMIRTLVIGGIATLAALLFERGLAHLRVGTRFAWTFALLATLVLPILPRLSQVRSPVSDVLPQITAPAIVINATSGFEARTPVNIPLLIALGASLLVLGVYAIAFVRLRRARRAWRAGTIANEPVFVSREFGPAVFGFTRPRIVVPEWVSATSLEEQLLIVQHEREHIAARDHWQLLLSLIATAIMPWNPFVWVQAKALRFRVETDCDQRVLNALPDRARYAELLINVSGKQSGLLLTPALAEHRNGLERRLTMLANRLIAKRWKAAALIAAGILATVVACESRLPNEVGEEEPLPAKTLSDGLVPTPRTVVKDANSDSVMEIRNLVLAGPDAIELIDRHYPPLLRSAGIGGYAVVNLVVHEDGRVDGFEVVRSAGHQALDAAALRVAKELKMLPTLRRSARGPQEYNLALSFDPEMKLKKQALQPTKLPDTAVVIQERVREAAADQEGPKFTPYDVKPDLANRDVIARALTRSYPAALRDAGIGGTALVWVLIRPDGSVGKTEIRESSGRVELDEAALNVAKEMRFTPARHKGDPVAVWIQLPIVFKTQ
jgi:TonB family protein